jgi:PAS domain-containing protein
VSIWRCSSSASRADIAAACACELRALSASSRARSASRVRAATIISLRESDIGRPLSDLTSSLRYPDLQDDARKTLDTLAVSEKQITTNDDRWFSVRIIPYRRLDNMIDGVVITLVDITETKNLESLLRKKPQT